MKIKLRKTLLWGALLSLTVAALPLVSAACTTAGVTTQDIQGFLQAVEGKEMVITLSDGSTVRITVQDTQSATSAQQLVGAQVNVRVSAGQSGERQLQEVRRIGEDQHFTGVIESISANAMVIGGRTFKVDANTRLDGGLRVGVTARVEFVTLQDNSMLATEIETDEEEEHFFGAVESIGPEQWTIGGQTFKVNAATRIEAGLAVGVRVRVEFVMLPDGSMLATEIKREQAENRFSGAVQSISPAQWVVDGKTFKVNAATRIEAGLAAGVKARVDFITLTDGSMLATRIRADQPEQKFSGTVESGGLDLWVISGKPFKVNTATRLEQGLAAGVKAEVRFVTASDGSMVATRIKADKSGSGKEDEFRGAVESISTVQWVVGGKTFKVNAVTMIDNTPAAGSKVKVRFTTLADGSMLATRIEEDKSVTSSSREPEHQHQAEDQHFTGTIEAIGADTFVISGKTFKTSIATRIDKGLAAGVMVRVHFVALADGSMLAVEIDTSRESGDDKGGGRGKG